MEKSILMPESKPGSRPVNSDIPPETLAAITAAVTVFLGTRFRIRSLEPLHAHSESVSRWTRQGRASIQASHNLRSKR